MKAAPHRRPSAKLWAAALLAGGAWAEEAPAAARAELGPALAADGECAAGGACALSALQLHAARAGSPRAASGAAAAASGAGARPCLESALAAGRGAEAIFNCHAEQAHLAEELSPGQLASHRARFALRARALLQERSQLDLQKQAMEAARLLREEQPVATRTLVDEVKRSAEDWQVGVPEWLWNLSVADLPSLGGHIDDPTLPDITNDLRAGPEKALPTHFDSRKHWPKCADVIGHVRNQGMCSSCWAQATAGTLDGRLCVATGGEFSGPRAWTSAGYVASCYSLDGHNGCSGGNAGWALQRAAAGGVPTGSTAKDTCVPYFSSGSFFDFLTGKTVKSPPCPASCTSSSYPRPLSADKFYPSAQVQTSLLISDFKRTLMEGGPMPMSFDVYKDFLLYLGGHYDHSWGGKDVMYKHATAAIGFERFKGKDYIISVNSWGKLWGSQGLFRMKADCCNVRFYLPGPLDPKKQAVPLPGPGPNCQSRTGGTCLLFGCDRSRGPATCSWPQCLCRPGYCSLGGVCVPKG